MHRSTPLRHLAAAALAAGIATTAAGCAGTATPVPKTAPPTSAAPSQAGPYAFARWTERQGFGGSSGINAVRSVARWMFENRFEITTSILDTDVGAKGDIVALIEWLDVHEPTACWAAFHTAMRASLERLLDDYAAVRAEVAAGKTPAEAPVAALHAESLVAYEMQAPANCP